MASGKSAVGKELSKALSLDFVDLDSYIEDREQSTIQELFDGYGEIYFRRKETECLAELMGNSENFVLSVGGGTPCYANNMELILKNSYSIYLKTSIPTIVNRVKGEKEHRPLIAAVPDDKLHEFVAKHLFERAPFYEQAAQKIITDSDTIEGIVLQLVDQLR